MSDDLRTRIAAAIAKADQDWCSDDPLHEDMADAVIRELGPYWREWTVESDYEMCRNLFLDKESAAKWMADLNADDPEAERRLMSRLITDWKADE